MKLTPIRFAIISCLLFLGLTTHVFGQTTKISGRILDNKGTPMEAASIGLYDSAGIKVFQTLSDIEGKFMFEKKVTPNAYLIVSFVQFGSRTLFLSASKKNIELGDINLQNNQFSLTEVMVLGKKAPMNFKVDKQVFSAGQFANAANGNGIDLIKNLPAVSVNGLGEISLRGSGSFQVMINGKPSSGDPSFILAQLSAASIENIEVITSPGATYDADGKSGIINVVTKTALELGWMVQSSVMYGAKPFNNFDNKRYAQPQRGSVDVTAGYRKNKWDVNLGFNYLRNDIAGYREGDVNTTVNGVFTSFPSNGERSFKKYNSGGRIAIGHDTKLGNRWEAGVYIGNRFQSRVADLLYNFKHRVIATGVITSFDYFNENTQDKEALFSLANVGYDHKLSGKAKINFSVQYEGANLTGLTINKNFNNIGRAVLFQQTNNPSSNPLNAIRFKTDYTFKNKTGTFNMGYQFRNDKQDGNFEYAYKNMGMTQFIIDPLFSSNLKVNNNIHAGYIQYSEKQNKLFKQIGLRAEHLVRTLTFSNNNKQNDLILPSLFPSFIFRYDAKDKLVLKTSYTRRVKRTNNFELNPLPEREHAETLEQGDPNLLPELTGALELGLEKSWQKGNLNFTIYRQDIKNPIQRVNKVYNDTILNRVFTNASRALQIGMEVNVTNSITPYWQSLISGNLYRYKIDGTIFDGAVNVSNASIIYSINSTQSIKIQKGLALQLSINYLSNRITAQGEDGAFLTPHLSLKKTTQDQRWTFQMQWLNIDMGSKISNRQRITTRGSNFYTSTNYIYETDQIQFSLSFNMSKRNRKITLPVSDIAEKEF
jgi:outer membrane receptor protein involved in Fe transport